MLGAAVSLEAQIYIATTSVVSIFYKLKPLSKRQGDPIDDFTLRNGYFLETTRVFPLSRLPT